jgi:hypothetical protein
MSNYNDTLREAGVLDYDVGVHPSFRDSKRIIFHDSGSPTVQSGPFPANEACLWIVDCESQGSR